MPAPSPRAADRALAAFRRKIAAARRAAGRQQRELAGALGLSPYALSHKLHGTGGARLTHPEVKEIVKTLAAWEAIATQDEAIELLALMGLKPESIPAAEWSAEPLSRLEPAAPAPEPPPRGQAAIPAPLTTLVGRDELVALVCERLGQPEVRLLTLLGPGGVGKTRVGLAVAHRLQAGFADGVFGVALAALRDPAWVPTAIAQALGIAETTPETGARTYTQVVPAFLAGKELLLVLDNVEHLLEATPFFATLLAAAPGLKLLVTSRAVLHLSGEHVIAVPPLAFPHPHHLPGLRDLARFPAIRLFVERAQAAQAGFTLTERNAPFVARICSELDGLPLALELAAARSRLFPPHALLARLDRRLDLLAGGPRDLPTRQQTLRATLAWSYDLLDEREQALFRRLAVFPGGCTLEALEAVSKALGEGPDVVIEGVGALLDQSLVRRSVADEGEIRLVTLETIREYALERLAESGEGEALRDAHAAYFLAMAEAARPHLRGPGQVEWADRIERDYDNFRAALAWAHERGAGTEGNELELCLAGALFWFWITRAYFSEGREWLEGALRQADPSRPSPARARALFGAGILAEVQGDIVTAGERLEESAAIWRELGDRRGLALVLTFPEGLGWVRLYERRVEVARALFEEGAALWRELGDRWGLAAALWGLGAAVRRIDPAAARPLVEESVALWRDLGDRRGLAYALLQLGTIARSEGDYGQARSALEESVALCRELGDANVLSAALQELGDVAQDQGDDRRAATLYREGLDLAWRIRDRATLSQDLIGVAGLAASGGHPARAVALLTAAETILDAIGLDVAVWPECRADYDRHLSAAQAQLDEATLTAARATGRALTPEEAVAAAREVCAGRTG